MGHRLSSQQRNAGVITEKLIETGMKLRERKKEQRDSKSEIAALFSVLAHCVSTHPPPILICMVIKGLY